MFNKSIPLQWGKQEDACVTATFTWLQRLRRGRTVLQRSVRYIYVGKKEARLALLWRVWWVNWPSKRACLLTCWQLVRRWNEKSVPFTVATQTINYLGLIFTKYMQTIQRKYKTWKKWFNTYFLNVCQALHEGWAWMKEGLRQWTPSGCSRRGRLSITKMLLLPKRKPDQNFNRYFMELWQANSEVELEAQAARKFWKRIVKDGLGPL